MRAGVLSGAVLLLLGAVFVVLDLHRLLSTAMIVWGVSLILRSLREQEPEDERSKRLRDRALANSWMLTAVSFSVILVLSEITSFEIESALLILLLLLVMLSTAAVFRVYYERRGDVDL